MRKGPVFLFLSIIILLLTGRAEAVTILEDDFTDKSKINMSQTTARVHTDDGGYIQLDHNRAPSALDVFGDRYAVVTQNGVEVYQYDTLTNQVQLNDSLSPPPLINARGVALTHDSYSMWVLTEHELLKYEYNGGMIQNPFLSVAGLSNVLAVTAHSTDDHVIVLTEDEEGKGIINWYSNVDGTLSYVPELSLTTDYMNARSVSMVPGTMDYVVITDDAAYYHSFGVETYNPFLSVSGRSDLVAGSTQDGETSYLLLSGDSTEYITSTGSEPVTIDALSQSNIEKSIAVSLNPGSYDRAILTEDGDVQYYSWVGDCFMRNSAMEVTGLELMSLFENPGWYYSVTINSATDYDEVKITAIEEKPAGTIINYYVSNDNGATWHDIAPDNWIQLPVEGNRWIVKAELSTNDESVTPKLHFIALEVSKFAIFDFEVVNITAPNDGISYTDRPLRLKAGSEVTFRVQTTGFGEDTIGIFNPGGVVYLERLDAEPPEPHTDDDSWDMWLGRYVVPLRDSEGNKIAQGTPIIAVIRVYRNGGADYRELDFEAFGIVDGDVTLDNLEVILIQ